MNADVRCLILALPALALVASCSGDELPLCADVSWLDRSRPAELTGAPTFSASQIAPGNPLTIAVPVSENTLRVWVDIGSTDETEPTIASFKVETDGNETVEFALEDTNLPAGVYVADWILLSGDILPKDTFYYPDDDLEMPYVLGVSFAAESVARCSSSIPVPAFEVVAD